MKNKITQSLKWVMVSIPFIFIIFLMIYTKQAPMQCKVLSHSASSDRHGDITYNTILSCEDGKLYNDEGMNLYILPIGSNATHYILKSKFQNDK